MMDEDRLREVELKLERVLTRQDVTQLTVSRIEKLLGGNGTPGMVTRVDRLEQSQDYQSRHFWALWPTALTAAAVAIWEWMKA